MPREICQTGEPETSGIRSPRHWPELRLPEVALRGYGPSERMVYGLLRIERQIRTTWFVKWEKSPSPPPAEADDEATNAHTPLLVAPQSYQPLIAIYVLGFETDGLNEDRTPRWDLDGKGDDN